MKFGLVITGDSVTRIAACRIIEKLGFFTMARERGLYAYTSEKDANMDVFVLDWEQQNAHGIKLLDQLNQLKEERQSVLLFCNDGNEKEHLEQLLEPELHQWQIKSFDMDSLIRVFL